MELFESTDIRKQIISFKIRNHLPVILLNQIYLINRGMAVKLPSRNTGTQNSEETWTEKRIILTKL